MIVKELLLVGGFVCHAVNLDSLELQEAQLVSFDLSLVLLNHLLNRLHGLRRKFPFESCSPRGLERVRGANAVVHEDLDCVLSLSVIPGLLLFFLLALTLEFGPVEVFVLNDTHLELSLSLSCCLRFLGQAEFVSRPVLRFSQK